MKIIAGVDIGNSTTEVCIGRLGEGGGLKFLSSASAVTTGTKGTPANVTGIETALKKALQKVHMTANDLDVIRLNEAAPVIGDTAMETITETIITDSSMVGHNPATPAGAGQAAGEIIAINHLSKAVSAKPYIITASGFSSYEEVAHILNKYAERISIVGLILQADEAVLVENRLNFKIPIIDEVKHIDRIPEGKLAAIEVALPGQSIHMLSNPYGIATLLRLNAGQTQAVTPIAKSLIGKQSAVVIKTPYGQVKENKLPAGEIYIYAEEENKKYSVSIDAGAEKIMSVMDEAGPVQDIQGEPHTNIGNMFDNIRNEMKRLAGRDQDQLKVTDILAVDTFAPVTISGALAGETCMEKAVGIAAMVKTQQLPMEEIADILRERWQIYVKVAGVEAVMASLGALTTQGTQIPLAVLDLGGGSTDAALIDKEYNIYTTHQAGAGELVSMLIQTELGLNSRSVAEQIKKYPAARVESLYHIRLENGAMQFFDEPLEPRLFGSVVLLTPDEMLRIDEDIPMEKIVAVRKESKRRVFLTNALRALKAVAPNRDLKNIQNVVLVGGCALDFEVPEMLTEKLSNYKIVCGRGNIRSSEGPRNAVATGLVLSYLE